MRFEDLNKADMRLTVLRALDEDPDDTINESLLEKILHRYGFGAMARDELRGELRWLEAKALVTIEELAEGYLVSRLTDFGLEVARGRKSVEGVAQPARRS